MNKHMGFDRNFNLLFYTMIIFVMAVSYYLYVKYQEQAGLVYFGLILIGACVFTYTQFFSKKDETYRDIHEHMRVPITTIIGVSSFVYIIGWIIRYALQLITQFTGLNLTSIFTIPLTSISDKATFLTFQSATVANSPGYTLFNLVINAGVTETLLFNLISVMVGIIITIGIMKMLKLDTTKSPLPLIGGIILSLATFVFLHNMNTTYTLGAFIFAGAFILISNIAIYYAGIPIMLFVGFHQANNWIYMIGAKGLTYTLKALTGTFIGWVSIIYLLLIIVCVIKYRAEIIAFLKNTKKN